ncbi:MAG: metallophosphoesterase family protein [Syntrophobacter sp.]
MKIAIVSDIHANLEAFEEVLPDLERTGAESIVCLGDCIGYGPDPEEVVRRVRSLAIQTVMGNHELGIAHPRFLSWFNESARKSLLLTEGLISEDTRGWLSRLDASLSFHGGLFVHGCPPDSITDYLFEARDNRLARLLERMEHRICFVGHTHLLELVSWRDGKLIRSSLGEGIIRLDARTRYIANIGSVGQPRDGTREAKYAVWDTIEDTLEVRFVAYNAAETARKILVLGFPRINADRLL